MNKLPRETRAEILHLLCEGNSIRSIERVTRCSKNTIVKLLIDAGKACAEYQDKAFRDLPCKRIQVDEISSFTYAKQKNLATAKAAPIDAGDIWTWTAICDDTKLVPSWLVGGRDSEHAMAFMDDLARRLSERVQLMSDGHKAYLEAVEGAFGADIDFAMLVKLYGTSLESINGRYSPAVCIGAHKTPSEGKPDPKHVSTSYAERQNLTMRMHMRRFTRLTNGFSKKVENHARSVALHFMYYNLVKQHWSLGGITPAMAAGVTDRRWDISDIVAVVEAAEPKPGRRGPYKKNKAATAKGDADVKS